jgi:hypothetical protein
MSRLLSSCLLAAGTSLGLAGCDAGSTPIAPTPAAERAVSNRTAQPAQAMLIAGVTGKLLPLLTVGDTLPTGALWAPIPDGLGGYASGNDLILYSNHELTSSGVKDFNGATQFPNARVSRLVIDRATLTVKDATYVVNGTEGYQRLCSATWVGAKEGFPSGYFFTGEEQTGGVHDGIQLAVGTDGAVHELPWIGRFSHENLTAVPYRNKVIVFGTDDTSGASELYMYVGDSESDIINGTGKLYVFKGRSVTRSGDLKVGDDVRGDWVEVLNPASLSSSALQTAVNGLGAFAFIRLEDSDYDHRPGAKPALYFVDTGAGVLCGSVPCDPYGSIYRLDVNPTDPTGPARLHLLARSQGAQSGWSSPDNIAAGTKSLMVNEDPANATFAGQRAPQVWQFGYTKTGITAGKAVIELDNATCDDVAGTCWESTGIIDASAWFGPGAWLFNVQAHTLPSPLGNLTKENGQLLLARIQGS